MSSHDRSPSAEQGSPADGPTARPGNGTNQPNASGSDRSAAPTGQTDSTPARRKRRRRRRSGRRPSEASGGSAPAEAPDAVPAEPAGTPAEPSGTKPADGTPSRRSRRRRRRSANTASTGTSGTADTDAEPRTAEAQRPKQNKRRKRRVELPPPGQIRGRRRTRSGRIEEVSSGGLVIDDSGDDVRGVLIGKHDRRGRLVWSLPKGHVELGETLEQTAVREIEEETGVTADVLHRLGEVDYWFMLHGEKIHKTVHHFLLRFTGGELSDRDVEVVEVAWVPLDEIPTRLAYPDERRLVAQVPSLLSRRSA
ncbi:MAG TPA: NUDIX domain-containing protein [Actinocatenispora sp.]